MNSERTEVRTDSTTSQAHHGELNLLSLGLDDIQRGLRNWTDDRLSESKRIAPADAAQVLEHHHLNRSFQSHCLNQLMHDGHITVGVIDDGNSTHAQNVVQRLRASLPEEMRSQVQVKLYDTSHGADQAFREALNDARDKNIVALSVSGGLQPINLQRLTSEIGATRIDAGNRDQAFATALKHFDHHVQQQMQDVKEASRYIPVVTPIWNDGNITPAALAGNVIVTSLRGQTHATPSELPDYFMEPLPGNGFSSQGPPRFIAAMLAAVGRTR